MAQLDFTEPERWTETAARGCLAAWRRRADLPRMLGGGCATA
jgi:hypothetical protein